MLKKVTGLAVVASLLSCTALVSQASAEATAPTLKISGNTVMNAYAFHQDKKVNGRKNGFHLANDLSDLLFVVAGKAANGWEYKYKMSMEALANKRFNVQQNFVQFDSCWGSLQIGDTVGPEDSMIEDGGAIVGATGAFDGAYKNVFNLPAFVLRGNDNIGDTGYATKIVYYSPEVFFTRLGLSYTPNTAHKGEEDYDRKFGNGNDDNPGNRQWAPIKDRNPYGTDAIVVGLSHKREFGNFGININGAYIHDNSYIKADVEENNQKRFRTKDVNAYQLGLILAYRTHVGGLLQLGGGWLDNGKSRLLKSAWSVEDPRTGGETLVNFMRKGNNGKQWNIALGYTLGAYKAAISYQETRRKLHVGNGGTDLANGTDKLKNQVVSGTFDVVPHAGLKFYGEVSYIRAKSSRGAQALTEGIMADAKKPNVHFARSNKGTVFILGTKVSF
jgi:predicted porin